MTISTIGEETCPLRASSRAAFVIWLLKKAASWDLYNPQCSLSNHVESLWTALIAIKPLWPFSVTLFVQIQLIIVPRHKVPPIRKKRSKTKNKNIVCSKKQKFLKQKRFCTQLSSQVCPIYFVHVFGVFGQVLLNFRVALASQCIVDPSKRPSDPRLGLGGKMCCPRAWRWFSSYTAINSYKSLLNAPLDWWNPYFSMVSRLVSPK